jgi:hypothetical protein
VADEREGKPEGDEAAAAATEVHYTTDEPAPQPAAAPSADSSGTSPAAADRQAAESHDPFTDNPELFVAGAFVGAYVFAKLLKKVTGSND